MNPYKPPDEADDSTPAVTPQINQRTAKPVRSFVVAVFVATICSGPFGATHPTLTVVVVVLLGFANVYVDHLLGR